MVNEHMRQATRTHDAAYSRDKSTAGLLGLYPDRILWTERIVEEHKTRRAHQDCSRAQALFYAGGLSVATGQTWTARITDLATRKKENIPFTLDALVWMERLSDLLESSRPAPLVKKIAAYRSCSYQSLCFGESKSSLDLKV